MKRELFNELAEAILYVLNESDNKWIGYDSLCLNAHTTMARAKLVLKELLADGIVRYENNGYFLNKEYVGKTWHDLTGWGKL